MGTYRAFAVTKIGISHTKAGKERQDSALSQELSDMSIAVIADGHGSDDCFRSAKGAEIAVRCAVQGIMDFVRPVTKKVLGIKTPQPKVIPTKAESDKLLRGLVNHIVMEWNVRVAADYKTNQFTKEELVGVSEKYRPRYEFGEEQHHSIGATDAGDVRNHAYGTTLIAAVVTPDYWFGIHIGDGRFTVLNADGTFDQPVPWDERCFLNATTSVCDDDAVEKARFYYAPRTEEEPPAAIFLCSDGVDDNYPVEENEQHLSALYKTIAQTFADEGFEATVAQLDDLANSFATKGKGDDTSIAGIIDMEGVKAIASLWKKERPPSQKKDCADIAQFVQVKKPSAPQQAAQEVEKKRLSELKAKIVECYNQNDFDQMIVEANKAISLYSTDSYAYTARGIAYGKKGNSKQAMID